MEDYTYTAKDFNINLYIRIHNYIAGFFGRNETLKDFCSKNDIDYKLRNERKYIMPDSYLINHGELKYLGGIRDKIILSFYEDYKEIQIKNVEECKNLDAKIANLIDVIEDNKVKLSAKKQELKNAKDPLGRIHLQDAIGGLETSITNEKTDLSNLKSELSSHKATISSNVQNWIKQIDIVDNIFAIRKEAFNRNISRKIVRNLNFTNYASEFPDYGDGVKVILKGQYEER